MSSTTTSILPKWRSCSAAAISCSRRRGSPRASDLRSSRPSLVVFRWSRRGSRRTRALPQGPWNWRRQRRRGLCPAAERVLSSWRRWRDHATARARMRAALWWRHGGDHPRRGRAVGRLGKMDHRGMKISLVVVCHHSSRVLPGCVESFRRQAAAAGVEPEVIVVEHSEDDGEALAVETCRPDRLMRRPNGGYAAGLNAGIGQATGELLFLANPDIEFLDGSVGALVDAVVGGRKIAGPQLLWDLAGEVILPIPDDPSPTAELARTLRRRWPRRGAFERRVAASWRVWTAETAVRGAIAQRAVDGVESRHRSLARAPGRGLFSLLRGDRVAVAGSPTRRRGWSWRPDREWSTDGDTPRSGATTTRRSRSDRVFVSSTATIRRRCVRCSIGWLRAAAFVR